ncbi:DegT/DnrJ/EryC1/StrS family aminotransferase [Planctobacterium marinum]|uniref:Aminotransferase DegT n=1 Tax=Planctobacterium marinum TaxID=1631968 RepID=A0AA48HMT1_9ALTE|nr:aminotransferase DegT [Planctobacterium marinum]
MIPVTKSYLPNKAKYIDYVNRIYDTGWLTNNGVLLRELEKRLQDHLGVKHLILVANGSLALHLAYKALELQGEVITTPFSFAATTCTLTWEGLKPVFADIDPNTFNLEPNNIEALITEQTSAIVPVHVFGNPCDVELIRDVALKHNLKVIYDAAHAFGTQYKGQSVLNYGDISVVSFHATKLFHTIEGGAIITDDNELAEKIRLMINFGIAGPDSVELQGTNAKMNEFEAAMGLCVLDEISAINQQRAEIWETYLRELPDGLSFQQWNKNSLNNHAYAPVLFGSEADVLRTSAQLKERCILPRRYFYPSLDNLNYLGSNQVCEISRDVASRILCLPIYPGLSPLEQKKVIDTLYSV